MRRRTFLAATFALTWARPLDARQDALERLVVWRTSVDGHEPGQFDAAAREVAKWPRADLDRVLAALRRLPREQVVAIAPRALLLHTDIAVLSRKGSGYSLPSSGRTLVLINDGALAGATTGTFHWAFCRNLLHALDGTDRRVSGPLWYRTAATLLFSWGEHAELQDLIDQGLDDLGEDAGVLLAAGALHQAQGSPKVQRAFDDPQTPRPPSVATTDGELRRAQEYLERAAKADPMLFEARVRLAHVRTTRGDHVEALREIARLRDGDADPSLRYYALLVVVRAALALGDLGKARDAAAEAGRLYPEAQSPRVALAYVAHMTGDRDPATDLLEAASDARNRIGDPWWWLERTIWPGPSELLARMRATVR